MRRILATNRSLPTDSGIFEDDLHWVASQCAHQQWWCEVFCDLFPYILAEPALFEVCHIAVEVTSSLLKDDLIGASIEGFEGED